VGYSILGALAADRLVSLPAIPVNWVQSVLPISAVLIIAAEIITLPEALAAALAGRAEGAAADAAAREATH
jgi:TRAP-type C4-dicarboxylate transport system permease small subunit